MLKRIILSLIGLAFSSSVIAGGFQLWEQDASGIGDNHAGSGAEAAGAGIEYYNPAGMTNLRHFETSAGIAYIPLNFTYTGAVGSRIPPTTTTATVNSDNYVPNFHLVYPINPVLALGFGLTVPFGLQTSYPFDNPIAVAATDSELKTVNLNPAIAYSPSKYFSLGAGFDVLYGSATYNSRNPFFRDFALNNTLSGWAYGWNAGAMFYLTPGTRIGVSYRSEIDLHGTGTSVDEQADVSLDTLNATLKLPPTWNFSLYSELNSRFAVLFTTYYTQWSVFDDLVLNNVALMGQVIQLGVHENYRNTLAFAAGLHVWLLHNLMLKVGFGHDETPTQDKMRDVRLPDADRWSVAVGLRWDICRSVRFDVGWMHFFAKDAAVNNSNSQIDFSMLTPLISMLTKTVGTSTANVNVVGVQLSWIPGQ